MIIIDLIEASDDIIKEYFLDMYGFNPSQNFRNLIHKSKVLHNTMFVEITHPEFLKSLVSHLKDTNNLFTITVVLPFFSDDSLANHLQEYLEDRYKGLNFVYNPIDSDHIGRKIHLYYGKNKEVLKELNEHYPEELV